MVHNNETSQFALTLSNYTNTNGRPVVEIRQKLINLY